MNLVKGQSILWLAASLFLVAGCVSSTQAPVGKEKSSAIALHKIPTPAEIASATAPAVVTIHAYSNDQIVATGTGFFIRDDGTFVTNMHLVVEAETLKVELADGEIFDDVYVLSTDDQRDLILLQIPTSGTPNLIVADDRDLRVGDNVYVVGNPLGLRSTFSDGIVSGKRLRDGVNYLQITAPISQGSSGGPVLNSSGGVVGVATSYFEGGQNLNMAVPARHASGLLAMAGAPESFDVLMARVAAEEVSEAGTHTTSIRAAETAELTAALPAHTQASLESLPEYAQQATVRMLAFGVVAKENGYSLSDYSIGGTLEPDGADGEEFLLPRGNYLAIGSCDDDCVDLDVVILDANGDAVAADREPDADSVVTFEVRKPARYTVGAHMVDCAATDCVYYVSLFEM
jgi:hypothetical protein